MADSYTLGIDCGGTKNKTNITKLKIYDVKRNKLQPRKYFDKDD